MLHVIDRFRFAGRRILLLFLTILVLHLVLGDRQAAGFGFEVPVKSIAQITVDDDNRPLTYPSAVFFDPAEDEIYVVNGSSGRVVVYGPDFFPRVSIGMGRGVAAPSGVTVTKAGEVFVCQVRNFKNPAPRISVLNGAFFVNREILLEQVPEAASFVPRQVAVGARGDLYLVGEFNRGLLVLDAEGRFLRRLQPMDLISSRWTEEINKLTAEEGKAAEGGGAAEGSAEADSVPGGPVPDVPEEFRPRKKGAVGGAGPASDILGPVLINHVTISRSGKLYLISPETGKIYVFGPDESFLFSFGTKGGSPGQMSQPRALAIDEKRELIYVVDYMRHTILVYDLAGNYLFEVGGRGLGPGWFNFPNSIALNSHGQLIVADLFNQRVQVLEVGNEEILPALRGWSTPASPAETPDAAEAPAREEPMAEDAGEPEGGAVEEVIIEDAEPSGYAEAVEGQGEGKE